MTAIISWFNVERNTYPYIMTVGDTKISGSEGTLTLEGAKILELTIKCKDLTTTSQTIYHESSMGYAYAGSTLVGLNVYCYLQTVFSNLGGNRKENKLPEYKSICKKAEEILRIYSASVRSKAEVLLFGFCPKEKIPFVATIIPIEKNGTLQYETKIRTEFDTSLPVEIIGDKKQEIRNKIRERILLAENIDSFEYWRIPAQVLKEIILKNEFDTIGGNIQVATCNVVRYDTYATIKLNSNNSGLPSMLFRNIDLFEDMSYDVGDCIIVINGLTLEKTWE